MSTNNRTTYDVRIDDYQRSILASALLTFICEGGYQGKSSQADLEEAGVLLDCLGNQNSTLEPESINDLTQE